MNSDLMNIAEKEITSMGFPTFTKGYYYLIEAVYIAIEVGLRKVALDKEVYQQIAENNSVTNVSVEKCIRNAIKKAWENESSGLKRLLLMYEPDRVKRPTNGEVISYFVTRIRLERDGMF